MKVFLELTVGDISVHQQSCVEHAAFVDFVKSRGPTFGCSSEYSELNDTDKETMSDMFDAENGQTPFLVEAPVPIKIGKLVFELYAKDCPKTTENFRCLCTGEKGIEKRHNKPMHYLGSQMFRAISTKFLHGGDFTRGDGSGGDSIYNGKFNDEKPGLKFKHSGKGLLSMANSGKNSNTSQFFITLGDCPKLDGKHVVFGKCVEGLDLLEEVVKRADIDDAKECPKNAITITDCGTC